ncbi:MAG: B12-binding domain-containing radical SAM protein [Nitrospirota bacterium]
MKIALIYPPFGSLDGPYISIPVLGAYLRSRDIGVDVLDANIELFSRLLNPDNMTNALGFAVNRFTCLNSSAELSFIEAYEYMRLVMALRTVDVRGRGRSGTNIGEIIENAKNAVRISCAVYYPEIIEYIESYRILNYISKYRKFSSQQILSALEDNTGLLPEVLDPIVREFIKDRELSLVGISATFPDQIHAAFRCAKVIKEVCPNTHVVLGGAFVSCHMRNITNTGIFKYVDSLIVDEGEIPLEMLALELQKSQPDLGPDLDNVPNLIYCKDNKIVINHKTAAPPLETLPPPAYELLPLDKYILSGSKMPILLRLSRGCYWSRCSFCRTKLSFIHGHNQPPADYLLRQIIAVKEKTGSAIINFTDDSASLDVLEALSQRIIEENIALRWSVNVRFDKRFTIERALLFRRAGCFSVFIGLESYNDRVLRLMKKGTSTALIDEVLSNLAWAGLGVILYMIVGFPTETEEEAIAGFEKVKTLYTEGKITHFRYHSFNIAPYSDIYDNPSHYHIDKMIKHDGEDLAPPISDFQCAGMSREQASALEITFNNFIKPEKTTEKTHDANTLLINNMVYNINYNAVELADDIKVETARITPGMPFYEWLETTTKTYKQGGN